MLRIEHWQEMGLAATVDWEFLDADGSRLFQRVANEGVLGVVAYLLGTLSVLDELVLELALLADRLLDPADALADLDVTFNATLFC